MPCSSTPARIRCSTYSRLRFSSTTASMPARSSSRPSVEPGRAGADDPDLVRISARPLEQRRLALPDADAERREPVAAAAAAKLVEQRDDEPRAAHPERMADRDRAAVHVHLRRVEPELTDHRDALRREGLVQLDEVEVGRPRSRSGRAACERREPGRSPSRADRRRRRRCRRRPRAARLRARAPAPRRRSRAPRRRR